MRVTHNHRKNAKSGKHYFADDFEPGLGQEAGLSKPTWYESEPQRLCLPSPATFEAFSDLLANVHPITQERLTLRTKTTCVKDGQVRSNRRTNYELTFSAPKSMSVMAALADDQRIITAVENAAWEGLKLTARYAATRVRKKNTYADRITRHLLALAMPHSVSRAGDPQLHVHVTLFNLSWDQDEQVFKALQNSGILDNITLIQAWSAAHLYKELRALGYELQIGKHCLEIAGVPQALIRQFSKRSAAIKKAVAAEEQAKGGPVGPMRAKTIALNLRASKQAYNWQSLQKEWQIEAGDGFKELRERKRETLGKTVILPTPWKAADQGFWF